MSMQRHDLGASAIQSHIGNSQSTHGIASEASAARLIRLLRMTYPAIESQVLTETDALAMGRGAAKLAAQGSLIEYLKAKIEGRADELGADRENPDIARTIALIDAMSRMDSITPENKKKIWMQMVSIAGTCPGIDWDFNHKNWSSNRIYNREREVEEIVISSPAETMNLVCAALLDTSRYGASSSSDEHDLQFRLESFCNRLLGLQAQKEAGQYEICSAGRQHEMLFLLNESYLDKPRDEATASPIQLIESTPTFLVDSLSSYIESELSRLDPRIRTQVVLDCMRWQVGLLDTEEYPLISYLKKTHGEDWRSFCLNYIAERCKAFGLNPADCKLDELIDSLPYLALPSSSSMLEPMMNVIFRTELFRERARGGAGVAGGVDDWDRLVIAANTALARMKSAISIETCENQSHVIRDFYKALEAMQSLNHYKNLTIFVGAEEGAFNSSREVLQAGLLRYYTDFREDKRLPTDFSAHFQAYLTHLKAFSQRSQVDFVENFFASLFADEQIESWLARLEALRPAGADKHPLALSDDILARWHQESVVAGPDGSTPIMDVSPYQINRILLHGLLVSPSEWTPLYAGSLELVTEWLLQPKKPDEAMLNTLKDTYEGPLLSNLLLLSLLNRPSFGHEAVKRRLNESAAFKLGLFYQNWSLLSTLIRKASHEERVVIVRAIEGHFGELITNMAGLCCLLELPESELSVEQRAQIWTAVQGRFGELIRNTDDWVSLFILWNPKLNDEQLLQVWAAVQGHLGQLIRCCDDVIMLLSRDESELNAEQRREIFSAVQGRWGEWIRSDWDLRCLFRLSESQLNLEERRKILSAVPHLIDSASPEVAARYRFFLANDPPADGSVPPTPAP